MLVRELVVIQLPAATTYLASTRPGMVNNYSTLTERCDRSGRTCPEQPADLRGFRSAAMGFDYLGVDTLFHRSANIRHVMIQFHVFLWTAIATTLQ
jgi:hypothetical protein